jgi:hypothetical protein
MHIAILRFDFEILLLLINVSNYLFILMKKEKGFSLLV